MIHKQTIFTAILVTFFLLDIPAPSEGFGKLKGGGGGGGGTSAVAEILAAGLITGLFLDRGTMSAPMMMQAIRYPLMMMHHHAMRTPMMPPPMLHPYMMPTMHHPRYIMNHAMMAAQASHHQAMTAHLDEQIRALEAQESILEAYLARNQQQESESAIHQLLSEEDTIPSAALLMETTELMGRGDSMDKPHPEMYEAVGSEPESRYILPRIVRHFVQRLMRRGEHH